MRYLHTSAVLSEDGVYRYELYRLWDVALPTLGFCMLNPSTADGESDDPTVKKCVGFAARNGYGSIRVVNLFAYRATDPKDLRDAYQRGVDIVGPDNDARIESVARDPWTALVVAWGGSGGHTAERADEIARIPGTDFARCLGVTAGGMPRHPLMLPYSTELVPYEWAYPSPSGGVVESNSSHREPNKEAGPMTDTEPASETAPVIVGESLADAQEPLSILLYGREGSAKTTDALMLAKLGPIIAIDAEGGMKPTALRARGVPVENIQIWPPRGDTKRIKFDTIEQEVYIPLRKALEDAREAGQPDPVVGIVIDSWSELSHLLTKEAAVGSAGRDAAKGKPRERFQINIEDYGTSTQMIRQLLRMFRDLGIHVVITSLERRDTDDDGFVQYGPALGPAAATDTTGMVDVVIWTQVEEIGDAATVFYTGTTRPRARHRAKDRFGKLPVRMIEPSADRVIAYVRGELTKQSDPRHKAAVTAARSSEAATS